MLLHREDLDLAVAERKLLLGCGQNLHSPDELIHFSPCHPTAGLRLIYCKGGLLRFECAGCTRLIMTVAVASKPAV